MMKSAAAILVLFAASGATLGQCPISLNPGPVLSMSSPFGIAIGDLNNDGRNDIVVVPSSTGPIATFAGAGAGAFGARIDGSVITGGFDIVLAHMNVDQYLDVVVATATGVAVFLNNGAGLLQSPSMYGGSTQYRQVVVADFNGDGRLDIAATSTAAGAVEVMLYNGAGGYNIVSLPVGGSLNGVSALDYDQDGDMDLVSNRGGTLGVYLHRGNGNGTFLAPVVVLSALGGAKQSLGDFSGDGRPDIAIINQADDRVHMVRNNGDGTFTLVGSVNVGLLDVSWYAAWADLNADGKSDLVTPTSTPAGLAALRATGPGTFAAPLVVPNSSPATQVATGDLNGDGAPDVVAATTTGAVLVYFNSTVPAVITPPASQSVAPGANTTFSVTACGAVSYAWRRNGVALLNFGHFSGVNTPTLTVSEAGSLEAGSYDCVVTGVTGASVTSAAAELTVVAPSCGTADFDGDGDAGTDADIEAFFRVLGGGSC